MTLATDIFGDGPLDTVLEFHGLEVTYHPKVGASRTVTAARVENRPRTQDKQDRHNTQTDIITLLFRNNDTTGITNPRLGEYITISDERYTYIAITERNPACIACEWKAARISRTSF